MRGRTVLSCGLVMAWLASGAGAADAVPDFTLKDADGRAWSLARLKEPRAVVVFFLSFECPVSRDYSSSLASLYEAHHKNGVAFVGVVPRDEGDAAEVAKRAKEYRLPFPVLRDTDLKATKALGATVTPEAFVLDGKRVLRYRGRIDDGYSSRLKKNARITREDLREAVEAVVAGKEVAVARTEAVGCPISLPEAKAVGKVTYHRDVAPILQKHCQTCHRAGGVGPFTLSNYRQARTWADDVKNYTKDRRMPPWKPVDGPGFRGERRMSDDEIATLAAWVDGGVVEGDAKDAPRPAVFADGWQLGEPDLVLTVPEDFQLGPKGSDYFRCFVLPTGLKEDQHVTAVEVRPGNARVVHHAVLLLDPDGRGREAEKVAKKRAKKTDLDRGPGYFSPMTLELLPSVLSGPWPMIGVWTPGQVPGHLPDGTGYYLPKGADLVLQVHYHRSGRAEKDRTSVGLYFAKKPPAKKVEGFTVPGILTYIPAGEKSHKVTGRVWAGRDMVLYSAFPHMHLLGKEMTVTITPPNEETRTLLRIKDWDFNWQETYFFDKPIAVKAGTRFDLEARFDNSKDNPANPHSPPRTVFPGLQTTDEMCAILFDATSDKPGRIWPMPFPPRRPAR